MMPAPAWLNSRPPFGVRGQSNLRSCNLDFEISNSSDFQFPVPLLQYLKHPFIERASRHGSVLIAISLRVCRGGVCVMSVTAAPGFDHRKVIRALSVLDDIKSKIVGFAPALFSEPLQHFRDTGGG